MHLLIVKLIVRTLSKQLIRLARLIVNMQAAPYIDVMTRFKITHSFSLTRLCLVMRSTFQHPLTQYEAYQQTVVADSIAGKQKAGGYFPQRNYHMLSYGQKAP